MSHNDHPVLSCAGISQISQLGGSHHNAFQMFFFVFPTWQSSISRSENSIHMTHNK